MTHSGVIMAKVHLGRHVYGLAAGQIWLWESSGETVSMAISHEPVKGVVRVSGVYTPPEKRRRSYAAACVHALSNYLRSAGYRCILYTD